MPRKLVLPNPSRSILDFLNLFYPLPLLESSRVGFSSVEVNIDELADRASHQWGVLGGVLKKTGIKIHFEF